MLPDRVSNPGPLTYESGALPIALRGPARDRMTLCVCVLILVMMFPEWLSGTEPLPHTHPPPCFRPRCVCSVLPV